MADDVTVYGIPNCDQVRRARAWLDLHDVVYRFHDFRRDGCGAALVARFIDAVGAEHLINRRGTTWRALDELRRSEVDSDAGARDLLVANPALIKRPVLAFGARIMVGFDDPSYTRLFA